MHTRAHRQALLQNQYLFTCCCVQCTNGEEINKVSESAIDIFKAKLADLVAKISVSHIKSNMAQYVSSVDMLIDEVDSIISNDNGKSSANATKLICECLDVKARLLAENGRFQEAAELVVIATGKLIRAEIYPQNDVTILREYVKAAGLFFSAGTFSQALELAIVAERDLSSVVSGEDLDLCDARRILRCCGK